MSDASDNDAAAAGAGVIVAQLFVACLRSHTVVDLDQALVTSQSQKQTP